MSPVVTIFLMIFIVVPLVVYASFKAIQGLRHSKSGVNTMILGLHLTMVGGIFLLDGKFSLYGIPYILVVLGFLISIYGFSRRDKQT